MHDLFYCESQIITEGPYKNLPYIVLIGIGRRISGTLTLSEEHSDYAWSTIKEAFNFDLKPEIRRALEIFISTPTARIMNLSK